MLAKPGAMLGKRNTNPNLNGNYSESAIKIAALERRQAKPQEPLKGPRLRFGKTVLSNMPKANTT